METMNPESGLQKNWISRKCDSPAHPAPNPQDFAHQIRQHPLIAQLLINRNITTTQQALSFLKPILSNLHDPALMPGIQSAAQRINQAVLSDQPIVIYGDYDVDGVTASAILYHTLNLANASVSCYVPHRLDEGYGINSDAIRHIASCDWYKDPENTIFSRTPSDLTTKPLIISVDCGITANEQATLAKKLDCDLIITDHHHFNLDNLPDAYALVHPRIPHTDNTPSPDTVAHEGDPTLDKDQPNTYPFGDLCGAGVAFKLAWQFARIHNNLSDSSANLPGPYKKLMVDLLPLVALGTVADVVPLVGENRLLTIYGLGRVKNTPFIGLNALIDASNLREEKVDAYHVGFVLGPRLNACGRMGHARDAVYLLTKASPEEAEQLASFLTKENQRRKETERQIVELAKQQIEENNYNTPDSRAIVVGNRDWHKGVVGIVASRLVEAYNRPTVVLSIEEDGSASGSARSVSKINIHDAFTACSDSLTRFGGHAAAAGCTLTEKNIDTFRTSLINHCNSILTPQDLTGTIKIDAEIDIQDINLNLFQIIQSLAPFGNANPKPVLLLRNVTLDRHPTRIGSNGAHLSLNIRKNSISHRTVGFGLGELAEQLTVGMSLDLVFTPAINTWMNRSRPDLHLLDIKINQQSDLTSSLSPQSSFA